MTCRKASRMSAAGILVLAIMMHARAHAQFYADTEDEVAIGLQMSHLLQAVQQVKSNDVEWSLYWPILIDGVEKDDVAMRSELMAAADAASYRSSIQPNLGGPAEGVFGPFQDFAFDRSLPLIVGDSCFVDCTFRLHLTGEKSSVGRLKFFHDTANNWRLISIDGMMSLLNSEAQTAKRIVKPQAVPKKKR